jgi:hypothetical protein
MRLSYKVIRWHVTLRLLYSMYLHAEIQVRFKRMLRTRYVCRSVYSQMIERTAVLVRGAFVASGRG